MNRINPTQINKTQNFGIKNNNAGKEVKGMEELIRKFVNTLHTRAEREVSDYGEFSPVFEQFTNPDKTLCATDFMLKISKPPKNIEGHEKLRNLEIVAYKLPSPYKAERIIATGSKAEILKQLQSAETLEKIQEAVKGLSHNLEDI